MKKFLYWFQRTLGGQWIFALTGAVFIYFIYHFNRWQYFGLETINKRISQNKPLIFCFWHGRMIMLPPIWKRRYPFFMLLSNHADGRLIAKIISFFGIDAIYGSTKRGGYEALCKMVYHLKAGKYIGITPDGPRGPRHRVSSGIAKLAQLTGSEIIPVTWVTTRYKILKTWDAFMLPSPFGQGVVLFGEPIKLDPSENLNDFQKRIEDHLNQVTLNADRLLKTNVPKAYT